MRNVFCAVRLFAVASVFVGCRDITEPLPNAPDIGSVRQTILSGAPSMTIPRLGTGELSDAVAINAAGQVVGNSQIYFNSGLMHAFLWQSGNAAPPIDLGTLGGSSTFASAVNTAGHVVGNSYVNNVGNRAFYWANGTMVDLGFGTPKGINASDQIVGWRRPDGIPNRRAVLWPTAAPAGLIELGSLGGLESVANAINASGQIAGWSQTSANAQIRGVVWQIGQPNLTLGTLGGALSEALAINTAGQVVGWSTRANATSFPRAVLWQPDGTMLDLGTLGGTQSRATAINDLGQVVGWSLTTNDAARHVFLWTPSDGMEDLGLIGWLDAAGVNDNLQIVDGSSYGPAQIYQINFQPRNYAPVVTGLTLPAAPVATGISASVDATFTDANAADTHTASIYWGDGTISDGTVSESGTGAGTVAGAHSYAAAGTYTVSVTVTDLKLLSGTRSSQDGAPPASIVIYVSNLAPVLTSILLPGPVATGISASVGATFTDANAADTHTASIDWGDGTISDGTVSESGIGDGTVAGAHGYAAAGSYAVSVTVTDQGSLSGTRSSTEEATAKYIVVYVPNAAPVVASLTLPGAPVAIGVSTAVSASFTDANGADTHTASISWGDGTTSAGTVSESGTGSGTIDGAHIYAAAGVYTLSVTITDQGSLSGVRSSEEDAANTYLVAYDPAAGYVAGHGSIISPVGAYVQNPTATGKAKFGFVSKYARGATIPSGTTQFQFTSGQFDFESTSYEWLVIAGARAKYKGSGTANGGGNYTFLLTAVDGQISGGGGTDAFRLKVWDPATGAVIYDNQMGVSDDEASTTALASGSIKIHM